MPQLISRSSGIPVPGGKVIGEYVGRVITGTTAASVDPHRTGGPDARR